MEEQVESPVEGNSSDKIIEEFKDEETDDVVEKEEETVL